MYRSKMARRLEMRLIKVVHRVSIDDDLLLLKYTVSIVNLIN